MLKPSSEHSERQFIEIGDRFGIRIGYALPSGLVPVVDHDAAVRILDVKQLNIDKATNKAMRNDIIYIRVFATILVVIGHCEFYNGFSGFAAKSIPGICDQTIYNFICKIIYTFHMPLFFAVSGCLFCMSIQRHGIDAFKFSPFLRKKAYRLLLPFIVTTVFYCIPIKIMCGRYKIEDIGTAFYEQLVYAESSHTWFLLALFWCMLIGGSMVLLYKRFLRYSLILVALLLLHLVGIPKFARPFVDWFCLSRGLQYLIFFILGFCLELERSKEKGLLKILAELPPPTAFTILVILEVMFFSSGYPYKGFLGSKLNLIMKDVVGMWACLTAFNLASQLAKNHSIGKVISQLNHSSFEIYLYSEPINYIVLYCCVLAGGWRYGDTALFWLRFFVTFIGAMSLSKIIRVNYGQK